MFMQPGRQRFSFFPGRSLCWVGVVAALLCAVMVFWGTGPWPWPLGPGAGTVPAAAVLAQGQPVWVQVDKLHRGRFQPGNLDKSLHLLEKACKAEPGEYELLWRLARAYYWQGSQAASNQEKLAWFKKARDAAERATQSNPNGVRGYYWLAVAIGKYGQTRGILQSLFMVKPMKEALDKCLALDPKFAPAHYVLEELYRLVPGFPLSIGDKRRALEEARLAVRYGPTSTTHWLGLGEAAVANGDYALARESLKQCIAMPVDPEDDVADPAADKKYAAELLNQIRGK